MRRQAFQPLLTWFILAVFVPINPAQAQSPRERQPYAYARAAFRCFQAGDPAYVKNNLSIASRLNPGVAYPSPIGAMLACLFRASGRMPEGYRHRGVTNDSRHGERVCGVFYGTGTEDYSAFGNPYNGTAGVVRRCTNGGGTGRIRY